MKDVADLPPVSIEPDVSAGVSDLGEVGEAAEQSRQAFDTALDDNRQANEHRKPQTRKAIKRSLDRLQGRSAPEATPGETDRKQGAVEGREPMTDGFRPGGTAGSVPSGHAMAKASAKSPQGEAIGTGLQGAARPELPMASGARLPLTAKSMPADETAAPSPQGGSQVPVRPDAVVGAQAPRAQPGRMETPAGDAAPGAADSAFGDRERSNPDAAGPDGRGRPATAAGDGKPAGAGRSVHAGSTPGPRRGAGAAQGATVSFGTSAQAPEGPGSRARSAPATPGTAEPAREAADANDPARGERARIRETGAGSASAANVSPEAQPGGYAAAPGRSGKGVAAQRETGVARREAAGPRVPDASRSGAPNGGGASKPMAPGPAPATGASPTPARVGTAGRESASQEAEAADRVDVQPPDMTGLATPAGVADTAGAAGPEPVAAPSSRAAELAGQVADRVLVSVPESGAGGEVRISLKESILDGSDVRIFREAGELRIVFMPQTASAGQFLAENQSTFQQALSERLRDERVHVAIESGDGSDASSQDNEGRSRQRYVPQDDPSTPA